jgi:predicted lipoprotein with Yx(FWY)xxD motif
MPRLVLTALALLAATAAAAHTPPSIHVAPTQKGQTLVDAKGMTLYVFDKDTAGQSACNGPCAANWPPALAESDFKAHGDWSVVDRADGSRQWAYRGRALYRWVKDEKPGDTTGDGFLNGAWHVAIAD